MKFQDSPGRTPYRGLQLTESPRNGSIPSAFSQGPRHEQCNASPLDSPTLFGPVLLMAPSTMAYTILFTSLAEEALFNQKSQLHSSSAAPIRRGDFNSSRTFEAFTPLNPLRPRPNPGHPFVICAPDSPRGNILSVAPADRPTFSSNWTFHAPGLPTVLMLSRP